MRLVTLRKGGSSVAGRLDGDAVIELGYSDVRAVLEDPGGLARAASADGPSRPLAGCDLAPVVPLPDKIICLGHNYMDHIRERGAVTPAYPTLFAKFAAALVGPRDPVLLPPESAEADFEVELAIVIGRKARRIGPTEARLAIAGFTIMNDVTMRDWQSRTPQWLQGKTFESTTPLGPALVTPDEVGEAEGLRIALELDGVTMQEASTDDMLFKPAEIVSYISTVITLQPGDVISTGTPDGVGQSREPPAFLRPGKVMRATIEGIGELLNACKADEAPGRYLACHRSQ
ncbi:MAG: fumarylacetoacetate hydrolase family protein [Acidimicrobiales bacterium]